MAGLGAGIAVGSSGVDAAGFGDGARARQYGFEKGGFTALERAHQRNAPWTQFSSTRGTSDVLSHRRLLGWSSARDWVGFGMVGPSRDFGKQESFAAVHREVHRDESRPTSRHCEPTGRNDVVTFGSDFKRQIRFRVLAA